VLTTSQPCRFLRQRAVRRTRGRLHNILAASHTCRRHKDRTWAGGRSLIYWRMRFRAMHDCKRCNDRTAARLDSARPRPREILTLLARGKSDVLAEARRAALCGAGRIEGGRTMRDYRGLSTPRMGGVTRLTRIAQGDESDEVPSVGERGASARASKARFPRESLDAGAKLGMGRRFRG
jgi:hypothetical protein